VRAALDHPPAFQHDDAVGPLDRRAAMRHPRGHSAVDAGDPHHAAARPDDAAGQAQHRRIAGARGARDRNRFPARYRKRDIFERPARRHLERRRIALDQPRQRHARQEPAAARRQSITSPSFRMRASMLSPALAGRPGWGARQLRARIAVACWAIFPSDGRGEDAMRRSFAILGGLLLGVVLSQFPEYAQQYTQRLGGAVDELRTITVDFDAGATAAGLTRAEALARYEHSPDTFLAGRGQSMSATFVRYGKLSAALQEIRGADAWQRLQLLPAYLDTDVGARTLADFKPAVPVTMEGLLYAAAGFVVGYILFSALFSLLMLPFRWLVRPRRWRVTE